MSKPAQTTLLAAPSATKNSISDLPRHPPHPLIIPQHRAEVFNGWCLAPADSRPPVDGGAASQKTGPGFYTLPHNSITPDLKVQGKTQSLIPLAV